MSDPAYSENLDEALRLAADAFRHTYRKGSKIPYLSHLLQVTVYVAEAGGDEDQLIAAVLHDYLEDIEGADVDALRAQFGDRAISMVEALSDTTVQPKPPWKERKLAYIAHLKGMGADVKLVSAADKLHNATSTLRDHQQIGDKVWERFSASKDETLWYYREIIAALKSQGWNSRPLISNGVTFCETTLMAISK